ncbi:acyltransferase ChoActase/COT/CPT [Zopfochytrium polystomum]|nr:acyltransferase ChoActase/COT/CPT [Zopfochytrium polystomum]
MSALRKRCSYSLCAPDAVPVPEFASKGKFWPDEAALLLILPIPTLQETCDLYLTSLRPILTSEEYAQSEKAVAEFLKPGGAGEVLQKRLQERDASTDKSWLIDWWNSYSYMGYRDPVVVWVSYFFTFVDNKKLLGNPAGRAAELIKGSLAFRDLVVSEKLEPETARSGPLCSHQYRYLFNSTRIPALPEDVTRNSDPKTNHHVIVIRKNKFYKLDTVVGGQELSAAELESQLNRIIEDAGTESATPVGLLTTEDRDTWAKTREKLLAVSPINRQSLDVIETAAFVVSLDDTKPVTKEQVHFQKWKSALLAGWADGKNRFFDKSFQFIVFENGKAGFNGEHSMMDATPTSRLCDWVLANLDKGKIDLGRSSVRPNLQAPQRLPFQLNLEITTAIAQADTKLKALLAKHDLKVVTFEGFGKNFIKKLQLSPDAFAQMAIQLAFFKMYGYVVPTYESAQTRKYAYGRTETCRSVSVESVAWVKAMENPHLSLEEKGKLGRAAIAAQSKYMARAVEGKGVDRHLLGLRLLIKPDEPKPSLFADPAYAKSCYWRLSTSQITSEYYNGYGWGEVVPDGYGCAYSVKDNALHFNLVSQHLKNDEFAQHFNEALWEMKAVFERTIPEPKAAPKAKL